MGVIPGRACSGCTVCCTAKSVHSEELQKAPGVTCTYCVDSGCSIYAERPRICQTYLCGYLTVPWLSEQDRPDRSGILVDVLTDGLPDGYDVGLLFLVLDRETVLQDAWMARIGGKMAQGLAVFLSRPGPPGMLNSRALLNDLIGEAVNSHDRNRLKAEFARVLDVLDNHAWEPFDPAMA